MTTFLALPSGPVWAQEAASDATTPMDKKAGNELPPTDNTLSNDEVKQLESGSGQSGAAMTGATAPTVSGTSSIYKQKGGSAAQSEGTTPTQ